MNKPIDVLLGDIKPRRAVWVGYGVKKDGTKIVPTKMIWTSATTEAQVVSGSPVFQDSFMTIYEAGSWAHAGCQGASGLQKYSGSESDWYFVLIRYDSAK